MNSPLRKSEIIRQLELRIVGGEFAAGQKLPSERELAEEYGVGRPVIREGLSGLVASGLVDIQVGRGTFVRGISVDVLSKSLNRVAARTGITTRHLVEARPPVPRGDCGCLRKPRDYADVRLDSRSGLLPHAQKS